MSDTPSSSPEAQLDTVRERPGGRSARVRALVLDATREELLAGGFAALSHRGVARRAGVDPATVYRRWPTRPRLAVDALLELAAAAVPIPDTGDLAGDLECFLGSVRAVLADASLLRLFHALSIATASDDEELRDTVNAFWSRRFEQAEKMIERGIERSELEAGVDSHELIERLVAPLYFRALVSGEPLDDRLVRRSVDSVVARAKRPA